MSSDLEKYLIPINDHDILISAYFKLYNIIDNTFIINDNIPNPREELKRWKAAYKKMIYRWHPDKLYPLFDSVKFRDESKKVTLKKKASVILHNMNTLFQSIVEILKKIINHKDK